MPKRKQVKFLPIGGRETYDARKNITFLTKLLKSEKI